MPGAGAVRISPGENARGSQQRLLWMTAASPAFPHGFTLPDQLVHGDRARILDPHFAYPVDLCERGVLILAGRGQEPERPSIVVLEADSDVAARAVVESGPAVTAGMFIVEALYPWWMR